MSSRVALVIGNDCYTYHPLDNPKNDCLCVGAALRSRGFNVTSIADASSESMNDALKTFYRDAEQSEICVFFFAGHAIEIGGLGYIIPVDIDFST